MTTSRQRQPAEWAERFRTFAAAKIAAANEAGLTVAWLLETHVHADHLSAAHYLKGLTGARLGVGVGLPTTRGGGGCRPGTPGTVRAVHPPRETQ